MTAAPPGLVPGPLSSGLSVNQHLGIPAWDAPAKHLCKGTSRRPQGWFRSLSHGKDAAGCARGKTHIPEAHTVKARVPVHGASSVASKAKQRLVFNVI